MEVSNQFSKQESIETQRKQLVSNVLNKIDNKLRENSIKATIFWRIKSPGSIKLKMLIRNLTLDQLNDIIGIRILVKTVQECYTVLNITHQLFSYDQDQFKDYIQTPKKSSYQSLHTILKGNKNDQGNKFINNIEVQIRTFEMHSNAEYGEAAHTAYKTNQLEQAMKIQSSL